jgi:hypothetical protein
MAVVIVGAPLDYILVGYPLITVVGLGITMLLDIFRLRFSVIEGGSIEKPDD